MFNLIIGTALLSVFVYLDGPSIVKNKSVVAWRKFKNINKLVSTNYKGCFKIIWVSLYMVSQALWVSMIQYLNSTIVQIDKNSYRVTYNIRGKTYMMIVNPTRGPRKVLLVSDETQTDISHVVFPYLGPEENFHKKIYTPKFFNTKELIFELSDGTEKIFKENDNILF